MNGASTVALAYEQAYQARKRDGYTGLYDDYHSDITHLTRTLQASYAPRRGRVLVLGCGAGDLAIWFAEQGFGVTGIDLTPLAIAWAQQRARDQKLQIDFHVGDVADLSCYPDNHFDMVFDEYCLHFIFEPSRTRCLSEVYRVLRPTGLFLLESICRTDVSDGTWNTTEHINIADTQVPRYIGSVTAICEEVKKHGFHIQHLEIAGYETSPDRGDLSLHAIKTRVHQ